MGFTAYKGENLVEKFDSDGNGYHYMYWIASTEYGMRDGEELKLQKNRAKLKIWGEINDDSADYSFDDWALVSLGEDFYLIETSGCSCPSPSENWCIVKGPSSIQEIEEYVQKEPWSEWTMESRQRDQFLDMIKNVKEHL